MSEPDQPRHNLRDIFDNWTTLLDLAKSLLTLGKPVLLDHDEYGDIQVYDRGDERYLVFEQPYEQSGVFKSDPARLLHEYTQIMMLVLLYQPRPRHVLLLGLGGGALVNCLHAYDTQIRIHAVELRAKVAKTAYHYFQLPDDPRVQVTVMDAADYLLEAPAGSAQIIFSDLYLASTLDARQLDEAFIRRCHRALDDEGWLVLNYFCNDRGMVEKLQTLYALFPIIKTCTASSGNLLVFAGKRECATPQRLRLQQAALLSRMLRIPLMRHKKRLQRSAHTKPRPHSETATID